MNLNMSTTVALFIVTASAILFARTSSAAVVHTEFADKPLSSNGVSIDLDGNGTEDFLVFYSDQPSFGRFIDALPRSGRYVASHTLFTTGIGPNTTIPDGSTWSVDGTYLMLVGTTGFTQGAWMTSNTELFVGLRIFQAGGMYYGWARVRNMGGLTNFVLRDWAY